MRSPNSITDDPSKNLLIPALNRSRLVVIGIITLLAASVAAQRVAVVAPQQSAHDLEYTKRFAESLSAGVRVLDSSQSQSAFRSVPIRDVYNMSLEESRGAAAVMGCDYFIVIRTGLQRRSSFSRPDYYEAFGVHYVVSGRTGELVTWLLKSFEADDQNKALRALTASINDTAKEIVEKIQSAHLSERKAPANAKIEEVPDPDSPAATNLKPPIPYRRIKPDYTATAFLYDVRATIDIEADVDSDGRILSTRIVRWAGFGLEESVERAVRGMNWRPAMRNGKPLPMRVLLRYNFTKVEQ
jgi:hypothetical protein